MSASVEKIVDPKSAFWMSVQAPLLDAAVRAWPRSERTPPEVAAKLDQAALQFRHADINYDAFQMALLLSLQAVELVMRRVVGTSTKSKTFGGLMRDLRPKDLTVREREWLEVALIFRNKLAHGESVSLTPGMADNALQSAVQWVYDVVEHHPAFDVDRHAKESDRDRDD